MSVSVRADLRFRLLLRRDLSPSGSGCLVSVRVEGGDDEPDGRDESLLDH